MVGRIFSQSPELYREILMRNPFSGTVRERFVEQAIRLSTILSEEGPAGVRGLFSGYRALFQRLLGRGDDPLGRDHREDHEPAGEVNATAS